MNLLTQTDPLQRGRALLLAGVAMAERKQWAQAADAFRSTDQQAGQALGTRTAATTSAGTATPGPASGATPSPAPGPAPAAPVRPTSGPVRL